MKSKYKWGPVVPRAIEQISANQLQREMQMSHNVKMDGPLVMLDDDSQ